VNLALDNPLDDRLIQLLRHFGLARAHFAACMPRDWEGLAAKHPEMISSLTLLAPMGFNITALQAAKFPLLLIAGDQGRPAKDTQGAMAKLPHAELVTLKNYFSPPWADSAADRSDQIFAAMRDFIARADAAHGASSILDRAEGSGEVAGVSFRVRGKGIPLVLMPLALSPSQWEPLIPVLSEHFCTIALGGASLGMVAHLEARAQSGYMRVIHQLIDETQLQPGQSVLEVGCGPGAVIRRLAQRTSGQNPIVAVDVNRYLLGEAAALARRDGVDGMIEFKEADAEHLPFRGNRFDVTLACTVLEEGDADRMLAELFRVTRPGGRVGVVVRSIDMPRWINLTLGPALKAKVDDPGLISGNVQERGCADASLYRRMLQAGLINLAMMPQWVSHNGGERLRFMCNRIAATLTAEEIGEWRHAVAAGEADGSFFIAEPFHCAVGTKP